MPYYSELGIYTPSSSYTSPLLKGPYSSHSSILASNILPPSSKQFSRANFRTFKPHLTTISESNLGAPLRRISSPKVLYHTSPKVRIPRPIKINTSDIDVSVNRYRNNAQPQTKPQKTTTTTDEPSSIKRTPSPIIEKEAKPNTEIRRDRLTIRLQTIHKDTLEKEIGQIKSWRDNFQPNELTVEAKRRKKTPGEILKEKFLIRSKSKENVANLEPPPPPRRLSVKKTPSFKDICNVITSDQVVEDLNPGQPFEVRRRQSRKFARDDVIKEIQRSSSTLSVEEVQILDALLQAENEVGLYVDIDEQPKRKRKGSKKKSLENLDDPEAHIREPIIVHDKQYEAIPTLKQLSSERPAPDSSAISHSRLRKDSSLKDMVKDISQVEIEMIPVKQKPVITGHIGTIEETVKNNLKAVVEDLEVEESPKPEAKEKKFRFNVTVQEFPIKKKINFPKCQLAKDDYNAVQIPSAQLPVLTSILKKRAHKCLGNFAGDGQIKEKRVKDKDILKNKLEKSLSEVQVRNKDDCQVKKSGSNDSLHSNFTVTVNKATSDEDLIESKGSLRGSGKLKIISIENSHDKSEDINNKADLRDARDDKVKANIIKEIIIPKVETTTISKEESSNTAFLLRATKKELRPDTFLCKKELVKKPNAPNWALNIVKDQTNDVKETKVEDIALEENRKGVDVCDENDDNIIVLEVTPKLEETTANDSCNDIVSPLNIDLKEKDVLINVEANKIEVGDEDNILLNNKVDQQNENSIPNEPLINLENITQVENKEDKKEHEEEKNFWDNLIEEKCKPPKLSKLNLEQKTLLKEIDEYFREPTEGEPPETPEEKERRIISKRSLIEKATKIDPDLRIFEPPTPPPPEPIKVPSPEPSFVPLQSNRLSQWMHPWKKPEQKDECPVEIFAKPKFIRARHIPRKWQQTKVEESDSEDTTTSDEDSSSEDTDEESEKEEERDAQAVVGASTSSSDSGFDSGRANTKECEVNCHKKCERLMANLCGVNQKLVVEAIEKVRKGSIDSRDSPGNTLNPASNPAFSLDFNDLPEVCQSSTHQGFQRSGRITPPATTIPRFRKYCVDDFNFLKVLGKGSFGKVLLAELKGTEYYYAIKCLKKDVVLEDDDVECTLIERKVLALGTKHPYLCHLLCTFQTESHLFFVMEYLNGGDLMFHIQAERRFSEARARFYGAEIVSGLRFLHNKGIVYRDLKLDNILLDFDGHVRIADFGMCKLQIFLDRMADTFCGTPDYMAPEIIKGQHYNQCVDWWSFGVLLYEMLLGQSPFSGCDEDELFWSICNEKPVIPRFLSAEAGSVLVQFLEKDGNKRLGNRFSPHGDIQDHIFFKPIDWVALEARRLEPPFKPNLQHPLDTQYFDKTFTTERAKLTPIETGILQSMDQTQFQGFSYTNPNATDK